MVTAGYDANGRTQVKQLYRHRCRSSPAHLLLLLLLLLLHEHALLLLLLHKLAQRCHRCLPAHAADVSPAPSLCLPCQMLQRLEL